MNVVETDKKSAWQTALVNAITDPKELLNLLQLDPGLLDQARRAAALFPLKVPRSFLARMQRNNLNDPLLRQVLPLGAELDEVAGYHADPLQETEANPIPGLLHKYHGRVLLTLVGTCGINCRYCFRREFPYEKNNPGTQGWNKVLEYIAQNETISEVILSGGDPLVVSDSTLRQFTDKLAAIQHVKRLRIHSRMPVVLPERITEDLIDWLSAVRFKTVLVTHCNHAQEINSDVVTVMQKLAQAGVVLLNQTVLLKGVNDNVETLIDLSEALFATGIQPYYLHVLDKVKGAAHFDLDRNIAKKIHWDMTQRLSGYLVPRLVCEQPGAPAKLTLESLELCTD
ncbi:MAG: EF-P beta-lysylation protein EpmB [Gammaproteobacteria bacterium]